MHMEHALGLLLSCSVELPRHTTPVRLLTKASASLFATACPAGSLWKETRNAWQPFFSPA